MKTCLRNRLPTKSLNISKIRVFDRRVFYLDKDCGEVKFDQCGYEGMFLEYSDELKAFQIWSSEKRKVLIYRDVTFFDDTKKANANCKIKQENRQGGGDTNKNYVQIEIIPRLRVEELRENVENVSMVHIKEKTKNFVTFYILHLLLTSEFIEVFFFYIISANSINLSITLQYIILLFFSNSVIIILIWQVKK